jgi:hypothetical protein
MCDRAMKDAEDLIIRWILSDSVRRLYRALGGDDYCPTDEQVDKYIEEMRKRYKMEVVDKTNNESCALS